MSDFQISKSTLPYDVSRGGQPIELLDLSIFQTHTKNKLNKYISTKSEELKEEYNKMVDLWEWNAFVETFSINFEPIIGETYFLYEGSTKFLSMLNPEQLKYCKFFGKTKLISDGYWIKI